MRIQYLSMQLSTCCVVTGTLHLLFHDMAKRVLSLLFDDVVVGIDKSNNPDMWHTVGQLQV
mgnify:CR=1 FL=1